MKREDLVEQDTDSHITRDVIIIGEGVTGRGIALDVTTQGNKTLLLEQADFAKGTSGRSMELIHGGVRYLAQGDIGLVREALRERGLLKKNAPHLVKNETFIIPNYWWWGGAFYTIGLKFYDMLSGRLSLGASRYISKKETLKRLPTITADNLRSGVLYHDGQFDDTRLAINVAQTCIEKDASVLNDVEVTGLIKKNGTIGGVKAKDRESGKEYEFEGKAVVNATGVFVDEILTMDQPEHKPMVRPSEDVYIVLNKSFLPGEDAILIPKTEDGQVLFAVPWHDKIVVGTTDSPLDEHSLEPHAREEEIEFILRTADQYLVKEPTRADIKSMYAGLRSLAVPQEGSQETKEISRNHKLMVSDSGLLTITGSKWTPFRKMGEDTVDKVAKIGELLEKQSVTKDLAIHRSGEKHDWDDPMYFYGSDKEKIQKLIEEKSSWNEKLHEEGDYIKAEVIWAVHEETALHVEDFLARRIHALFLDARHAIDMAPDVARLMALVRDKNSTWTENEVAQFSRWLIGIYWVSTICIAITILKKIAVTM